MISNGKNGILFTQSKLILIIWSGLHDFSCIDQFSIWFFVVLQKKSISSCTWVKLPWQIGVNKKKQIISICRRKLSTTLRVQTRSQFEWTAAAVIIPNRLCMLYMFSPLTTPTFMWNGKNPLSRVSIVFLSAFVFTIPDPSSLSVPLRLCYLCCIAQSRKFKTKMLHNEHDSGGNKDAD